MIGHSGPQYINEYVLFGVVFGIPAVTAVAAFLKPVGWVARRRHRTVARALFGVLADCTALVVMWALLFLYVLAELSSGA